MLRRSAVGVSAAVAVAALAGGGVATASPPVAPQITDVDVVWDLREWDDGVVRCTSMVDAWLDPAYTKGPRLFASATWSYQGQWQIKTGSWTVERSAVKAHLYTASFGDPLVVDSVTVELKNHKGVVLDSMTVPTTNTCPSG